MFDILIFGTHLAVLAFAAYVLFRRDDEVPLFIAGAVTYFGVYRYIAIMAGLTGTIDTGTMYNLSHVTDEELARALGVMVLGEAVLVAAYAFARRSSAAVVDFSADERRVASLAMKPLLVSAWCILAIASIAQIFVGSAMSEGVTVSFGYGYATHISFMRIGAALLLFQFAMAGAARTEMQRAALIGFFVVLVLSSFIISQRFEFIGWILGVGLLWSYRSFGVQRVLKLGAAMVLVLIVAGAAGALRGAFDETGKLGDSTIDRLVSAEDANMLDGLALLLKVYPELLPYRYGGSHLEVLYRPIPRAIWEDKPKGGYVAQVTSNSFDYEGQAQTGFSPSLFGSFYEEGGVYGVVLLSILYGLGFASLVNWAQFGTWPQAKLHTQYPGEGPDRGRRGNPVFDAGHARSVAYLASNVETQQLVQDAGTALLDKIGPAIVVTHSQAGPFGWLLADARPKLVKGIVAIEPSGPPFENATRSSEPARAWGPTDIRIIYDPPVSDPKELRREREARADGQDLVVCSLQAGTPRTLPNLRGIPIVILTGEASYHAPYDHCTSKYLTQAGVANEHVRLASVGFHGNGHSIPSEKNSLDIAAFVDKWMREKVR